jgi:hypothetical protein
MSRRRSSSLATLFAGAGCLGLFIVCGCFGLLGRLVSGGRSYDADRPAAPPVFVQPVSVVPSSTVPVASVPAQAPPLTQSPATQPDPQYSYTPPADANPPVGYGGGPTLYDRSGKPVHVEGYTKKNGTYVAPHDRAAPGTSPGRHK